MSGFVNVNRCAKHRVVPQAKRRVISPTRGPPFILLLSLDSSCSLILAIASLLPLVLLSFVVCNVMTGIFWDDVGGLNLANTTTAPYPRTF